MEISTGYVVLALGGSALLGGLLTLFTLKLFNLSIFKSSNRVTRNVERENWGVDGRSFEEKIKKESNAFETFDKLNRDLFKIKEEVEKTAPEISEHIEHAAHTSQTIRDQLRTRTDLRGYYIGRGVLSYEIKYILDNLSKLDETELPSSLKREIGELKERFVKESEYFNMNISSQPERENTIAYGSKEMGRIEKFYEEMSERGVYDNDLVLVMKYKTEGVKTKDVVYSLERMLRDNKGNSGVIENIYKLAKELDITLK